MRADWYKKAFVILHIDHHTREEFPVGRDADEQKTRRLIELVSPDILQIHAKGNPGWTTYPSEVGFTPPRLERDVMEVWRRIANQLGLPFSAYYNLGRDREIMKRTPEWNRVDAGGVPDDNMLSYSTVVTEAYLLPMIDEIGERYEPEGFWFDGSCFTVKACYREECVARFRAMEYDHAPRSPLDPDWDAYKEMHREIYRELVRDTAARVHERNPRCLVAVNVAYGLLMPERPDPGIDYLTQDIADNVERIGPSASIRDAQRLPYDFMVTVWASDRSGFGAHDGSLVPKSVEQLQQEAAIIISRGGRFSAWDNPTDGSGLVDERTQVLAGVTPWLRDRQPWCLGRVNVPDVSVLHSPETHYANTRERRECFVNAAPAVETASAFLDEEHLVHEVIPGWRLEDGEVASNLLVVEHPHVLTAAHLRGIRELVEAGAEVLLTGDGAVVGGPDLRDALGLETATVLPRTLRLSLEGAPGVTGTVPWYGVETALSGGAAVELWGEVRDESGERLPLLLRSAASAPGGGALWFSPVPLFTVLAAERARARAEAIPPCEETFATDLARAVLARVLPPERRRLTTDAPQNVHMTLRRRPEDGQLVVHLVNRSPGVRSVGPFFPKITDIPPAPPATLTLAVDRRPRTVTIEPGGEQPAYAFSDGRLEIPTPGFAIHRMIVIDCDASGDE